MSNRFDGMKKPDVLAKAEETKAPAAPSKPAPQKKVAAKAPTPAKKAPQKAAAPKEVVERNDDDLKLSRAVANERKTEHIGLLVTPQRKEFLVEMQHKYGFRSLNETVNKCVEMVQKREEEE